MTSPAAFSDTSLVSASTRSTTGRGRAPRSNASPGSRFDELPIELKRHVISFLPPADAVHLACVNKSWSHIAENRTWSSITLLPPSSSHPYKQIRVLEDGWKRIKLACIARPDRAAHVRRINMATVYEALADISFFMRLITPHVEDIELKDCIDDSAPPANEVSANILDSLRVLPALRHLTIEFQRDDWGELLFRALRSTPALVTLSVVNNMSRWFYEEDLNDEVVLRPLPELTELRTASFQLYEWTSEVCIMVRQAPDLQELHVVVQETREDFDEETDISMMVNNQSILHFVATSACRGPLSTSPNQWLPALQTVTEHLTRVSSAD